MYVPSSITILFNTGHDKKNSNKMNGLKLRNTNSSKGTKNSDFFEIEHEENDTTI